MNVIIRTKPSNEQAKRLGDDVADVVTPSKVPFFSRSFLTTTSATTSPKHFCLLVEA